MSVAASASTEQSITHLSSRIMALALDEDDTAIVVFQLRPAGSPFIVGANSTYSRLLGRSQKDMLGAPLSVSHGPATNLETSKRMEDAMRTGKGMRGQIELLSLEHRSFWFGFTVMPVVDPVTGTLHSVMLGRDITVKLREDREQAMLQDLLVSAFQKVDAAVLIAASDGRILLSNEATQIMTGYRASELHQTTTLRLTAPAYQAIEDEAHKGQIKTGVPYQLDIRSVRKDGTEFPVHLTSVLVQPSDGRRFRVVTMRSTDPRHGQLTSESPPQSTIGSIQFLGLEAVKAAFGPRWTTMRDRLMLSVENILKRGLSKDDVFNRTADDGFNIWFKQGSEEENGLCLARLARQIRIALLSELGEETNLPVRVRAYTVDAPLDPTAPQSSVMASVSQNLAARRKAVEQEARELITRLTTDQPRELIELRDRTGQQAGGVFVDLPRELRGRFSAAMSLVGELHSDVDVELFRLGLATSAVLDGFSQGNDGSYFIAIPFGIFMHRRGRDRFLEQWRTIAPAAQMRLVVVLTELPSGIVASRVKQVADLLRPIVKAVAIELDDIETLPFTPPDVPVAIVGLVSAAVSRLPETKLQAFFLKIHNAKRQVVVRLALGESPVRWQKLGTDFTAAF